MARHGRQKPAEVGVSDDELPELSTLLEGSKNDVAAEIKHRLKGRMMETSSATRTSPRRRGTMTRSTHKPAELQVASGQGLGLGKGIPAINLTVRTVSLPPPISPVKKSPVKGSPIKSTAKAKTLVQVSPVKRSAIPTSTAARENSTATSMQQRQRPLKMAHVNSLLLPLSQVALGSGQAKEEESDVELVSSVRSRENWKVNEKTKVVSRAASALSGIAEPPSLPKRGRKDAEDEEERNAPRASPKRAAKEKAKCLSRFILKEARCDDDSSDSGIDNDAEEECTDLSGFIVDDDAELSFHGSDSDVNNDSDSSAGKPKGKELARKRGLQLGRRAARTTMESEDEEDVTGKEYINVEDITQDLFSLKLRAPTDEERGSKGTEVIDLTFSPLKDQPESKSFSKTNIEQNVRSSPTNRFSSDTRPLLSGQNDQLVKFSPPRLNSPSKTTSNSSKTNTINKPSADPAEPKQDFGTYETPPNTPPASPTKLKSPSKLHLLSPSKRGAAIPTSPHRQSIDAFWSSDVINSWNDQYSPRKLPLTASPKKTRLAKLLDFDIWSDSDNENLDLSQEGGGDGSVSSSLDLATPIRSSSPRKTPISPSKRSSPSKKAAAVAKKDFESTRHGTAQSLFTHLDTHITSGKLSTLSASTGGVRIIWSKSLRSTAGRANWRRTVTKPAGSPTKSAAAINSSDAGTVKDFGDGKPLVQHYASIELAEKVIDSDSRLVNTLAHEFCHLANFMVSGVRDQPHGVSFRAWAGKVTTYLRTAPGLPKLYRNVEVTTKHSYVINHKYLWVCAGQSALPGSARAAARAFLALGEDLGCGAEYGRHSKSIDPEKHRCGKCKGLLVQVRPTPKVRRAEPETGKAERSESPRKGKRAIPSKRQKGSDAESGENDDAVIFGSNDKLDGLENALECVNLSD